MNLQRVPNLIRVQRGVNKIAGNTTIFKLISWKIFLSIGRFKDPWRISKIKIVQYYCKLTTFVPPHFYLFQEALIRRGTCCTCTVHIYQRNKRTMKSIFSTTRIYSFSPFVGICFPRFPFYKILREWLNSLDFFLFFTSTKDYYRTL